MKSIKSLLLCFLLFGSLHVLAEKLDLTESFIYSATKEACSQLPASVFSSYSSKLNNLKAGYFPSNDFTKILTQIRHETFLSSFSLDYGSTSETAKKIKNSPAFRRALFDCYNKDQIAINYFKDTMDRSSAAGKWMGSFANLIQFYGMTKLLTAGIQNLKKLSAIQTICSEKYAWLHLWSKRAFVASLTTITGMQVYDARKSIYDASLIVLSKQEKFLNDHPKLKEWLRGELNADKLALEASDLINQLNKESNMLDDIIIISLKEQIINLYAKRAELSDPEDIKIVDNGIKIFTERLKERQALKKQAQL